VRPDLWWAVISGGTDFASAFLAGTPELPTVPGEMQARCLGDGRRGLGRAGPAAGRRGRRTGLQAADAVDAAVFWGDADHRRYHESYFDTYPGVWRHGDWLRITPAAARWSTAAATPR
jgi:acetoacetyl-CoA synthetase